MKMFMKCSVFIMGVATGIYFASAYEDEIDDMVRSSSKLRKKMKHSLRAMNRFLD